MRVAVAIGALLAGACCSSLPRLTPKHVAFPAPRPRFTSIIETSGQFNDARRGGRAVPIHTYAPQGAPGRPAGRHRLARNREDRDSYAYLGRALARAGFYVVHVTHAGTDRAVLERGYRALYRATKQKENWINRPLDVSFVLDRLRKTKLSTQGTSRSSGTPPERSPPLPPPGMRSDEGASLRDPRVKVIVPMSMPRIPGSYDAIDIPVLHLTGTCDTSPALSHVSAAPAHSVRTSSNPRQVLVTLRGVNHDMFSAKSDPHHDVIAAITIAFLRAWLQDDAQARAWFEEPGRGEALGVPLSVERKTGIATAKWAVQSWTMRSRWCKRTSTQRLLHVRRISDHRRNRAQRRAHDHRHRHPRLPLSLGRADDSDAEGAYRSDRHVAARSGLAVPEESIDMIIGEVKEGASGINTGIRDPKVLQTVINRFGEVADAQRMAMELLRSGSAKIRRHLRYV
jgi:hypothetical protein